MQIIHSLSKKKKVLLFDDNLEIFLRKYIPMSITQYYFQDIKNTIF